MVLENPYAHSLDGLEIEDPVQSFFDYCKRREAVRVKESQEKHILGAMIQFYKKVVF